MCIQLLLQSPPKVGSSALVNFHLPISPLLVHRIILTITTNTPLPIYLSNFESPHFCAQPSQQSRPKILSLLQPFSQFTLRQGTRDLGSLVRTSTVLISFFFFKYGQWYQGLQSLIPYHSGSENWWIAGCSIWWGCLQLEK